MRPDWVSNPGPLTSQVPYRLRYVARPLIRQLSKQAKDQTHHLNKPDCLKLSNLIVGNCQTMRDIGLRSKNDLDLYCKNMFIHSFTCISDLDLTNLVKDHQAMLHTIFQAPEPSSSGDEDF